MIYDIIIIGAGPAGMTAAMYAKQSNKNILIIEKNTYGGQILKANKIKNYPGFDEISGFEFATNLYNQIKKLNIDIIYEEVIQFKDNNNIKEIITNKSNYFSKSIIIATGGTNKKLNINNENNLIGKGVSYCTTCDGMFFKNKEVAIYGGGKSAIDGALYLSDICKNVYIIYRGNNFKEYTNNVYQLKEKKNVKFIFNTNIIDLIGEKQLESIKLKEKENIYNLNVNGLFIEIGYVPVSEIFKNIVNIDPKGYIVANENCTTNINGIFVAGDIRAKQIRQLTTACSDGTIAALNACKYITKNH